MDEIRVVDGVAVAILAVATLRGALRGLMREALSIGGLAAAVIVVRMGTAAGAAWLVEVTKGQVGAGAAPWIVGIVLAIAVLAAAVWIGRMLRSRARAAGLGWFDNACGGLLGLVEGGLVAIVLLLLVTAAIGRDASVVQGTRSLSVLEQLEHAFGGRDLRVTAPARRLSARIDPASVTAD